MRFRLLPIAVLLLAAAPAAGQVHYTVSVEDPSTKTFHVRAEVGVQPGEEGEAIVGGVTPQSAAAAAGVREGDVLRAVGEVDVAGEPDWGAAFRERYAGAEGEPLPIVVQRDGEELTLEATVRTRSRTDVTLTVDAEAGERAARLREGWLAR